MKPELASLFTSPKPKQLYSSLLAELRAIRSGKKAISVFTFPWTGARCSSHNELFDRASKLGLLCIEKKEAVGPANRPHTQIRVFVTRESELWRIPCFNIAMKILNAYDWSEALEYLESSLLGYSDIEIKEWLDNAGMARIGWVGMTIYAVLDLTELRAIRLLGMKCFDSSVFEQGIIFYFSRKKAFIGQDAISIIDDRHFICRFSVDNKFFDEVVRFSEGFDVTDVVTTLVAQERICELNLALQSKIYLLTVDGWL